VSFDSQNESLVSDAAKALITLIHIRHVLSMSNPFVIAHANDNSVMPESKSPPPFVAKNIFVIDIPVHIKILVLSERVSFVKRPEKYKLADVLFGVSHLHHGELLEWPAILDWGQFGKSNIHGHVGSWREAVIHFLVCQSRFVGHLVVCNRIHDCDRSIFKAHGLVANISP
jgi:hypothetical protein